MNVNFNPAISNNQCRKQSKKMNNHQNPAFCAVNQKWLKEIAEDSCDAYENTIYNNFLFRNRRPGVIEDLKDTIKVALKKNDAMEIKMITGVRECYQEILDILSK